VDAYEEDEFERHNENDKINLNWSLNDLKQGFSMSSNRVVNSRLFEIQTFFLSHQFKDIIFNARLHNSCHVNVRNQTCGTGESKYKTLLVSVSGATLEKSQFKEEDSNLDSENMYQSGSYEDNILDDRE
jgi:hypothetical protein